MVGQWKLACAGAALLVVAVLGAGCSSGGGGSGQAMPTFMVPDDGSVISEPTALEVVGTGIDQVRFEIDGVVTHETATGPFQWTLDPATLADGVHQLTVTARQGGLDYSVVVNFGIGTVPGGGGDPIVFALPREGASITAPAVLVVMGNGLDSVGFFLDGVEILRPTSPPFEWRLDPDDYQPGPHGIRVDAVRDGTTESRSVNVVFKFPAVGPEPTGDPAVDIAALRAGQWYEIPNTKLSAVAPDPLPSGGLNNVIGAWSGGAYDTKRDRFIIFGGGHADYSGNEVYAFSMKTFQWIRLTDPSPWPDGDVNNTAALRYHPDGRPVSRHSYEYLEYIPPPVDRFFCGGGGALWKEAHSDPNTYLFDFDNLEWELKSTCPSYGIGAITAVDPDGIVWQHGPHDERARLTAYDASTDTWTVHAAFPPGWFGYRRTGAIEPEQLRFFAIGAGEFWSWDLQSPNKSPVTVTTSGDNAIEGTDYPGVEWDPIAKRLVAWNGGATVYELDLTGPSWTATTTTGVGTTPPTGVGWGVFGRWRYVPSLNVFVTVLGVNGNVYVYRHSE